MHRYLSPVALIASIFVGPVTATAQPAPTAEFSCAKTTIARLEHRLLDGNNRFVAGSGSAVRFANGLYQVSYNELDAVRQSRNGDPVFMCLVLIPRDCPPGDNRGRTYTTTNLRTLDSWTMADSSHRCGGA